MKWYLYPLYLIYGTFIMIWDWIKRKLPKY